MDDSTERKRLPPNQQLVAETRWPFVGETASLDDGKPWTLTISGRVKNTQQYSMQELARLPQTLQSIDIHCVTRWSKFDVPFRGVLLSDLLDRVELEDDVRFVSFVAKTERRHCSSLPLQEALDSQTLLATEAQGQPLGADHGGPLRGVVSGKYFYKSVKWVERIELLAEDTLGHWESNAGYHNGADPWLEQRYISGSIDKRAAGKLSESRDYSGQNLLSLNVARRDLTGLLATDAILRNADFSHCMLQNADFRNANLSNAKLCFANLRDADLTGADLEGADLSGADLRGARLDECSLFGASFCQIDEQAGVSDPATLDPGKRWSEKQKAALTAGQRGFLESLP